jgi:excisionase family DNA binding protein
LNAQRWLPKHEPVPEDVHRFLEIQITAMIPGDWLSLSEVAKILGVHPSTVRNWADAGHLPVHRTQGGHRRFRRGELELWMQSQRAVEPNDAHLVIKNALKQTRLQINEGVLEAENWYRKLDRDARRQYRRGGRTLLQGLMAYLASDRESAEAEARAMGFQYASIGRRCGLSSVDATNAFLFFRNLLVDSMLDVFESAAVSSPRAWGDMLRKINAFTDQIMLTLLESYKVYERDRG